MRHRDFSGPSGATLATLLVILITSRLIKTTHQIDETTIKQANNQTATSSSQQVTNEQQSPRTTNQTTTAANLTSVVESLNERLVKQSNLQAEESRQDEGQTVFVPAPVALVREQQTQNVKRAATFVSGGSGDSYLSMSHDGSNRYDFGFDTSRKREHETRKKPAPRLMREESRLEDGTVIGRYGYTDPFNVFRIVQYVAGPDGYFASEDVGALETARDSSTLGPEAAHSSSGPKFQLNKQLHKALEQARALRRASNSDSNNGQQGRSARKRSSSEATFLEAASSEPAATFLGESARSDDTLASGSSDHQSVRFATRINHVVGTNGITYATAFRPTPASPTMASAVLSPHQGAAASQEQQASASKPVYVSTRYEPFKVTTHHDLRSQLPAPIWAPTNEDAHGSLNYFENSNSQSNQQQQVAAASYYPPATQHQSSSVLQSHPAWTLLNNNYNNGNYQTSLFIDHASAPTPQQPAVGQSFALDAHREAQLLAALNERHPPVAAPAPVPVVPVSQPVDLTQVAQDPTRQSESFAPIAFGARTASPPPPQVTATQPSYNYGFALRHFDAPLYHPEVHETRADQIVTAARVSQASQSVAGTGDTNAPGFSYATTVMHSEVAAEQAYKPERLPTGAPQSELVHADPLRSSASSSTASLVASSEPASASAAHQTVNGAQAAAIARSEPLDGAAAAATPLQPVAYATRLSALADDELSMEDSEQVGYLPNGTHTSHLPRARLPDRSKKLSSIFKARHLGQEQGEASAGEAGTARIRRPVPVNAKKQFAVPTSGRAFVQPTGSSSHEQEQPRAPEPKPLVAESEPSNRSAPTPPKSTATGKKFGANLRQAPASQDPSLQDDTNQAPVVAAKKRPIFVEPTKSKQLESGPAPSTTTSTTTTSTTTTTEAPQASSENSNAESFASGSTATQAPQAVVVDATGGLASSGQLSGDGANRDLLEKIMRIQQELASKAAKLKETPQSATTTTSTTSTTTSKPTTPQVIEQPTTTTTTTTERPPTTTTSSTTTTFAPSTSSSSSTTTTSAPEVSEVSGAKSSDRLTLISDNELSPARESQTTLPPVASSTTSTTTEPQPAPSLTPSTKNLLTGPLVRMVASSSDQDDFMSMSMTADSLGFDSTRALVMSSSSPIRVAGQTQAETIDNSKPGAIAAPLPVATERANKMTSESAPEAHGTRPITTTKELVTTETVNFAPQSANTTTVAPSAIQEAHNNQTFTPVTAADLPQTTTTSTTTSTTTAKPVAQRVRTTSQPAARFGRLVIKRGDKVVARYNASDAIPDSMIPVSGTSGEIIMPDMPRLGMRRSVVTRRRASSASSGTTTTSTSTTTTTTTTTERPARTTANASEPQLANATPVDVKLEPVAPSTSGNDNLLATSVASVAPSARPTATASTTSGRNETTATATTNQGRLKRKSLLRGARSPTGQAHSESDGDLINEESAPAPQATSVIAASRSRASRALEATATRQPAAPLASSRFGVRNSWSSRLRDNIGRQMAEAAATTTGANATQSAPKKYDPDEDLKKLVEKIERIQFESSAARLARDRDDVPRRPVKSDIQIDVLPPPPPPSSSMSTHSSANHSRAAISEPTTTVISLPVAASQQVATQMTTPSSPSANTTTHFPVQMSSNASTVTPGLSNRTTSSQSSSISFTLAVSPDIESQWSKLKPVNLTTNQTEASADRPATHLSALITRLTSNSTQQQQHAPPASNQTVAPRTQLDIRVDSHGHIHVRNNQSITVHVDIEPPKRNSTQKRITSRDTSAVSALFGRDDIQRSRKQTTTGATSRASPQATTPAGANPNQAPGEETAALLKRRPRMLCIEVESNDSDLLRQKRGEPMTRLQTPRIAPDVAP